MSKTKLLSFIGASLLLVAAVLWFWRSPSAHVSTARQDSPETILNHVRTLKSPLVLINFWASWCEPCKGELPALLTLKNRYSEKGLQVILVSIDDPTDVETAVSYLRDNQLDFTSFYKGAQPLKFVSQIYPDWTGAVPASLLVDRELKILDAWEGDSTFEELEKRVQQQLKGS